MLAMFRMVSVLLQMILYNRNVNFNKMKSEIMAVDNFFLTKIVSLSCLYLNISK